ncbi:Essential protein Yae1, N terminal [Coccidioides posadasii str. Silveira]|uniref:Protein YAE1 n=1 Tax=Coccidioides posadasii (strain RMSCC 757 / Silveira) TaxID=443226 RepID=E9DGA9_COCPS|nr:conserved hypothetical protein [Coccidioides posadasii str. Silveira]QVM12349.1 Essential protein Yae1, N terminal [Coccidioides posadasii str. Silveira]
MAPSSVDSASLCSDIPNSAPPSPSTALSSPARSSPPPQHPPPAESTGLDDIFGSSPPPTAGLSAEPLHTASSSHCEPSDLPSLRRQHVTAGYRDGISAAKHEHVQRGFDAGFPVGAQLGMRVGVVLGVLEGLVRCSPSASSSAPGKRSESGTTAAPSVDILQLYDLAKSELAVQKVFGGVAEIDSEVKPEQDSCLKLEKAGEEVVSKWEETVMRLLGNRS